MNPMFQLVSTDEQKRVRDDIWKEICSEKGFKYEQTPDFAQSYLILENDEAIGCLVFVPYNPKNYTTVEHSFKFSEIEDIKNATGPVFELDKLALKEGFRSKGYLIRILHAIKHHTFTHFPQYYIALMESVFFRAMNTSYKAGVEKVGKMIKRDKSNLTPVIFNVSKALEDGINAEWYKEMMKEVQLT